MLRRLAGLDGSQGTSADNEVAVGATAGARVVRSPGRTGTGADGLRGSRAAEEPAGAWLATAGRSAGRSRNRDRRPAAVSSRRGRRRRRRGGC